MWTCFLSPKAEKVIEHEIFMSDIDRYDSKEGKKHIDQNVDKIRPVLFIGVITATRNVQIGHGEEM